MGDIIAPRKMQDTQIRIYKNAVSDEFCDEIIDSWESMTKTREEKENHNHSNTGLRRDKAIFMDDTDSTLSSDEVALRSRITNSVYDILLPATEDYLKDVGIYDDVYCVPHNVKVQKYDHTRSGGYYAFHSEQSYSDMSYLRRLLTYMIYLNDVPEGEGETEFLNQGVRVKPSKGDLVIWPAFFTHIHRGNPVYTTDKYIATGWLLWEKPPKTK